MKKTLLIISVLLVSINAVAQIDTLRLSTSYTTHVIFSTDLTYADLSNTHAVAGRIIEQNKNMLALKARTAFTEPTSISALESNGKMHTYIVIYDPSPTELVVDTREKEKPQSQPQKKSSPAQYQSGNVSIRSRPDTPSLQEVFRSPQRLFHLGSRQYDITVLCENIVSYSDASYLVLSLKNGSGINYETVDAAFVVEDVKKGKRTVSTEKTIFPKSRYGTLTAVAGKTSKMVYSFDKLTLAAEQVLRIYIYEEGGSRNFVITVPGNDINKAKRL